MTVAAHAATTLSLGQRISELAERHPERIAVVAVDAHTGDIEQSTWAALDRQTAHVAARLAAAEDGIPVWLTITNALPDIVLLLGALRAGLLVAPLNATVPAAERERYVDAVRTAFGDGTALTDLLDVREGPSAPPEPLGGGWILLTGGTTGVPKPILGPEPPRWNPARGAPLSLQRARWRPGQVQLVLGPLHHAAPFTSFLDGVLSGNTLVVANGYYPELLFELINRFHVEWLQLAPVHMTMAEPLLGEYSMNSLRAILHTSAPCPHRTKLAWIGALGPERVFEMYGATEGIGTTLCDGSEWLARPGTVGRGFLTRIRIADPSGRALRPWEVGEVWMRTVGNAAAPGSSVRSGGYRSVGDHGYLDSEGFLFLRGRGDDVVIVGGENVYLGEVEAALLRHPAVADAAVRAVEDEVYGVRLAADVVLRAGCHTDTAALKRHCREQLPEYKRPRSYRVVAELPRNAAGKLIRDPAPTRSSLESRT
ncbi:AMP-binding protein [Nocardia abscessus]|uniref:AMP-binding protein n=1 Tax=Nocardia abscessus TaxID=120957 RepID=UPI002458FA31|nr:AMP-binding protein [Nocardia abscessus]